MKPVHVSLRTFIPRIMTAMIFLTILLGSSSLGTASAHPTTKSSCTLISPAGNIQHVIHVQFDNTHFTRDNPNVPSDLEQMPNLLNFIKGNGSLISQQHTPLISHTATDLLTSLTGIYGDRHGVPVSNSYGSFNPDGSVGFNSSFGYWTDPVSTTNTNYNMLSAPNTNTPAPWVAYTRAGCNFGAAGVVNTVIENTKKDIPVIFGANSSEATELQNQPFQAYNDFMGLAVHCAKGNALCSTQNSGKTDALPSEPGGYTGYNALFGNKYIAPQLNPSGPLTDLNGKVIADSYGGIGFPGFDGMTPAVSLAYVASMQEHNVPVTYAYIADAHDAHTSGTAYGPGEAGYVATLKSYDDAFGKFFVRLAKDGINKSNTLFVFTADEGDHFTGGAPTPTNCNGISIPCTYNKIGEIDGNLAGLLATQQGITTPFSVHSDSAPTVYITGNPARDASITRAFERGVAKVTAINPISNKSETITNYLADPVEMKLLHIVTVDPTRTPTFTLFAKPDYYLSAGAPNCNTPCIAEGPAYAWNHGDVAPDINTTWLGMVGPGVRQTGINHTVWSDHTDTRPTILAILGLKDDYRHDGRVLLEIIDSKVLPTEIRHHLDLYIALGEAYKQINAPVGKLGLATLNISTTALKSGDTQNDKTYIKLENSLQSITNQRDTIASQMIRILESAEFGHPDHDLHTDVHALLKQSETLYDQVQKLQ